MVNIPKFWYKLEAYGSEVARFYRTCAPREPSSCVSQDTVHRRREVDQDAGKNIASDILTKRFCFNSPCLFNAGAGLITDNTFADLIYKPTDEMTLDNAGRVWAVDMDLEKFFDTVNPSKLIEILSRDIKDGSVISLIHKYLRAGVIECDRFIDTEVDVPQGGPLSSLYANIMLNELDHKNAIKQANTRKSYWRKSLSLILTKALNNMRLTYAILQSQFTIKL